jgi:hypothetical protein
MEARPVRPSTLIPVLLAACALAAPSVSAHHPAQDLRDRQVHAAAMERLSRDAQRWDRVRHWRAVRVTTKRQRVRLAREHQCAHLLTAHQRDVARTALHEADRLGAPWRARVAMIAAGIVESWLRNLTYGHADSEGWLQARVGIHGTLVARSVRRSARKFLTRGFWNYGGAIRLAQRRMPIGRIAQLVQGSAFPARYGQVVARAKRIVRCY